MNVIDRLKYLFRSVLAISTSLDKQTNLLDERLGAVLQKMDLQARQFDQMRVSLAAITDSLPQWMKQRNSYPDYVHGTLQPEEFRDVLLGRGAVMLRGAVDPGLLDKTKQKLDELLTNLETEIDQHLGSDDPQEREIWEHIKIGQVYDRTFARFAGFSFYDLIRDNGLWDLASHAFPESQILESDVCNCRRMTTGEVSKLSENVPLEFHVDAQVHNINQLSINFWTPLVPCGRTAPSIKVVLVGAQDTKGYLEFSRVGYEQRPGADICNMRHFLCEKEGPESLREHDMLKYVWAPTFNKGDILAFTSLTMHATHCLPGMSEARTSVEVRINLPSIPL